MVITLGKILIRNHETDLFEEFFYSQNCMYMSDAIVSTLVQESLTYLVPECCVPIFALCSADFRLKMDNDLEKKQMDYQSNKSDKQVSEMQLQDSLQLQKVVYDKYNNPVINIIALIKASRQQNADKIVTLMLDHNSYGMHSRSYIKKVLQVNGIDVTAINLALISKDFMHVIFKNCSINVFTRFIESEWRRKCDDPSNDAKLVFLSQLLVVCGDTSNQ